MNENDRTARARAVAAGDDAPPRQIPLFVWLVVVLVAIIGIALSLVLSAPAPQVAAASDTQSNDDRSDGTHTYGKSAQATPTPIAAGQSNGAGSAARPYSTTTMTPAPGLTPCADPSTCAAGVANATANANTASQAYGQAASAAVTSGGATVASVPAIGTQSAQPQPQATVLVVSGDGAAPAGAASALDAAGNALTNLRSNLAAQEAALKNGSGGTQSTVPAIQPAPTATPRETGLLGTPILPPPPYAVPMGTCVKAMLLPNVDSSLAGPVYAHIVQTYYDPRNRQPVIPPGTAMGHYVGLTGGATHLGVQWDWLEYPDLEKRQLTSEIATTATSGENGLSGRINTHLFQQFRNTLVNSIVGDAGQILATALTRGSTTTIATGAAPPPETTIPGSNVVPTLYQNRATPFCLLLTVDYDAAHPYTGTPHE